MAESEKELDGLHDTLGIEIDNVGENEVTVSMVVTPDHHQPAGYMHGGVSLVLAETAASVAADVNSDDDKNVFGMEINANHLKPFKRGRLRAIARPLHKGKTSHVWEVNLRDDADELICRSRCTLSVQSPSD